MFLKEHLRTIFVLEGFAKTVLSINNQISNVWVPVGIEQTSTWVAPTVAATIFF